MKKAAPKVEVKVAEFRVWCESCCIRIAPNEEQTAVRGKTYHLNCFSKLPAARKVKEVLLVQSFDPASQDYRTTYV